MSKISTYAVDGTPSLDDKLIGTDVNNNSETKNYLISDIIDLVPPTPIAPLEVFNGLTAQGIDNTTTSVMGYGVNVFTTITDTDFCTKLPQPVTGKTTRVVNMTGMTLTLHPSNVGGKINNLLIDTPVSIPPDGIAYEFTCIENPLPGAWTWTPPATNQRDSGTITGDTTLGVESVLTCTEEGRTVIETLDWLGSTTAWASNNRDAVIQDSVRFRPTINWNAVTKIKVYTNLSAQTSPSSRPEFELLGAAGSSWYSELTGDFIVNGVVSAGSYSGRGYCNQTVGTAVLLPGELTANAGDDGTLYGTLDLVVGGIGAAQVTSMVGQTYEGIVPNTYLPSFPLYTTFESWFAALISFQIKPKDNYVGFKYRFILEYN